MSPGTERVMALGDALVAEGVRAVFGIPGSGLSLHLITALETRGVPWFCTVAEHVWRARAADRFMASANGRSMGTALPMAIGAALADPSRPVVCAMGDGGVRMYLADVRLAVSEKLPILFLLLSDGRYGSVAGTPGLSRRATTIVGPSWFRAVDAMDCPAAQVKAPEDLVAVLERWRWREGPLFVEAVFEPERYAAMTREVR